MLPDKNKIIKRNEPSCADQKAEILQKVGRSMLEFSKTQIKEKLSSKNCKNKQPQQIIKVAKFAKTNLVPKFEGFLLKEIKNISALKNAEKDKRIFPKKSGCMLILHLDFDRHVVFVMLR